MALTAKDLQKTGARGSEFNSVVRSQISLIDDQLHRAERHWGRNVVAFELTKNISIGGLKSTDAQRIVYSSLIKDYRDRGFEVRLLLEPDRPYMLYLAWVTDLNQAEVDAMNKVIGDARITPPELEPFLADQGSSALGAHSSESAGAKADAADNAGGASEASDAGEESDGGHFRHRGRKISRKGGYRGAFDPGEVNPV